MRPLDTISRAAFSLAAALALALAAPDTVTAQAGGTDARTVTIRMTDFAFEPAKATVGLGDTVRFVQTTSSPHNVEFRDVPAGARLGEEYIVPVERIGTRAATYPPHRMGPYLVQEGQTYEFVVTEAFATGTYGYICTPHEPMGMTGELVVEGPPGAVTSSD